jgi:hypothetical protein
MKYIRLCIVGSVLLASCTFSDPELDREIEQYRGTGIQQQGNVMPPHELEDIED